MAYHMEVVCEDDYLHIYVTGDNTPEDVIAYLDQIRTSCVEHGCPKVLIEENLTGPPFRAVDVYDVVDTASRGVAPAILYVALVDTNPAHDFAQMKFAETVAVNRGVNIKVFRDIPSAKAWIRSRPTPVLSYP